MGLLKVQMWEIVFDYSKTYFKCKKYITKNQYEVFFLTICETKL
jgi:hypothetical protein